MVDHSETPRTTPADTYMSKRRCTVCGEPFDEFDEQEGFGFDYNVGYGSKYDLEHIKMRFCCKCFDSILDIVIPMCKLSPFGDAE